MNRPNSRTAPTQSAALLSLALACFFFSGMSGLVYEVVWVRMMGLVFGATALAVSTVLASYMAGLALGSYIFGRIIDRRGNPLRVYGILELAIAGFALLLPLLLNALNHLYRPLYAGNESAGFLLNTVRFFMTFFLLLIPTTLMGGTLPVLARFLAGGQDTLGRRIGALYAANTFGAVLGTFGTGFVLIPYLGLRGTVAVAVVANVAVGITAIVASRRVVAPERSVERPIQAARSIRGDSAVLLAFGISGFVALLLEVAWTRFLAMVLGTTVYAFTTMLTTFLLGIALGSFIVSRFIDRIRNPVAFFGWMEAGLGLSALATLFFFNYFPEAFLALFWKSDRSWWQVTGIKFLLALAAMFVPCLFMGSTFPVVTRIYARDLQDLGRRIGLAYAFNTVGAILGSLAGGFILLPWVGMEWASVFAAILAITMGLVLLGTAASRAGRTAYLVPAAAVALATLIILAVRPPLDRLKLTRGVYVYAPVIRDFRSLRHELGETHMQYYKEESDGIVSVEHGLGSLSMRVNGKTDASNSLDMPTQVSIAHLPLIVHPDPHSVLIVGLGSGVSVGSAEQHPLTSLECVEISEAVREASAEFNAENHDCLSDPRLRMIHADGRNHLLLTQKRYDVIISQPSNPWISGIGYLFTREAFEIVRGRLNPGGIACQWFQSYQMTQRDFRSILRTFHEVFPHVVLWMSGVGDVIMLGSADPIPLRWDRVKHCYDIPAVRQDLARVGLESPASFLTMYLMGTDQIPALAGPGALLHTDDNLLLEFGMSRDLYAETLPMHLAELLEHRVPVVTALADAGTLPGEVRADLQRRFEARGHAMEAVAERARDREASAAAVREALRINPDDPLVREVHHTEHYALGTARLGQGDALGAIPDLERAAVMEISGATCAALQNLGAAYAAAGQTQSALLAWGEALARAPDSPDLLYNRGLALSALGRTEEAMESYRGSIRYDPEKAEALNNLAWLYAEAGVELDHARDLAHRAVAIDGSAGNYDTLGWVYFRRREYRAAQNALTRSLEISPDQAEAHLHLGMTYLAMGDRDRARDALEQAVMKDGPDGPFRKEAEAELKAL